MNTEELEELINDCPRLYHMAERGAWEGIKRHGLLSTSALLDLYNIQGDERHIIESTRRKTSIEINAKDQIAAKIRDQLPMDDRGLQRCLPPAISPQQWYEYLNNKVFFWLTKERLDRLSNGREYRDKEHEILVVDTRAIIENHYDKIWFCPINSGCTKPMPHPRSYDTFQRIDNYPYANWRNKRKAGERVVELCVDYAVPDLRSHICEVYVVRGTTKLQDIA